MGRAFENWLRSADHDKFAAAALKCLNASGACISDGFCHYGNCFGQEDAKRSRQEFADLKEMAENLGYRLEKVK